MNLIPLDERILQYNTIFNLKVCPPPHVLDFFQLKSLKSECFSSLCLYFVIYHKAYFLRTILFLILVSDVFAV